MDKIDRLLEYIHRQEHLFFSDSKFLKILSGIF